MFQYGIVAGGLRIEHQHADGSTAPMELRDPHDPSGSDPEREWRRGHVFVCTACEETIEVTEPQLGGEGGTPGAA